MSEAVLRSKTETIPLAFADGAPVEIDPWEANEVISAMQAEHGVGTVASTAAIRPWFAQKLNVPPERIDLASVAYYCDVIIEVVNALVEHRKKKSSETANLLLSTLDCPPISDSGQQEKNDSGLGISPASTHTESG